MTPLQLYTNWDAKTRICRWVKESRKSNVEIEGDKGGWGYDLER